MLETSKALLLPVTLTFHVKKLFKVTVFSFYLWKRELSSCYISNVQEIKYS